MSRLVAVPDWGASGLPGRRIAAPEPGDEAYPLAEPPGASPGAQADGPAPVRQARALRTRRPAVDRVTPEEHADRDAGIMRAELPASLTSARRARTAVRQALAAWGMRDPSGDAELLASELVANAAEHARGPISLAVRRQAEPGTRHGITCEVTDTSPTQPQSRQAGPGDERGRGLAIVAALASDSGVRAGPSGKTTWFTLALHDRLDRAARRAEPEPELEAGA
jgi:anti-sigma regulatory factor (Ser/Thr protein kinase)